MRKIRWYGALFGVLAAAAVSVTACGGTAKRAETVKTVDTGGTEEQVSPAVKNQTEKGAAEETSAADPSVAEGAEENGDTQGTSESASNGASGKGGAAGFQPLDSLISGENDGSGAPAAQPITGAEPAEGDVLEGIPIDAEKSEAVSIYYGGVCYSYFSEEKEKIKEVVDLFRGFSLEEVKDGQLDEATTYQVYFSTDTEQIAAVNVDRNGEFYIPEEKKFYRIKAGTFHFEELDRIYKDSMYQDGFDENQCLIQ